MNESLTTYLKQLTAAPVDPVISTIAKQVMKTHPGAEVVLAYGSALRDSSPADTLIDLYVLTKDFAGVSSNIFSRIGCRLVAPNVYFAECRVEDKIYRAKYAVLPLRQFVKRVSSATGNPYFWARFAQPSRIVWAVDEGARTSALQAIATATRTAFAHAKALSSNDPWIILFQNTYRTELRPESIDRARMIVQANAAHYDSISANTHVEPIKANWALKRLQGKGLSVLRLMKAAFTFQGGADYIAWKIQRHSGVEIKVTDFQRRHPLIAAITLAPMLIKRGAVK